MSNASASGARATATRSLPARGDVTLDPRGPNENIPTAVQTMAIHDSSPISRLGRSGSPLGTHFLPAWRGDSRHVGRSLHRVRQCAGRGADLGRHREARAHDRLARDGDGLVRLHAGSPDRLRPRAEKQRVVSWGFRSRRRTASCPGPRPVRTRTDSPGAVAIPARRPLRRPRSRNGERPRAFRGTRRALSPGHRRDPLARTRHRRRDPWQGSSVSG